MLKAVIFVVVLLSTLSFSNADEITLTSDIWPPYTMDPKSGKDGYLIDLARAAFQMEGHTIIYKLRPYNRAIKEVESGKANGVVGIYRQDAVSRDLVVSDNELGVSVNTFFVKQGSSWKYDNTIKADSLKGKSIGIIQDYVFDEIESYLQANKGTNAVQYMKGGAPLEKNLKKLVSNRIDITIDDEVVVKYMAAEMKIDTKIQPAGSLSTKSDIVIGFSAKNKKSKEYSRILSDGIEKLRGSGELADILNAYGLSDWRVK